YFDDSKGTNVGAVVAALAGFPRPVVLIAGGRDKGGDYAPLAAALGAVGRGAVLIGEAAERIAAALPASLPVKRAASMEEAISTDRILVGAVLLLMAFGLVMVFSSGAVFAARKYGDAAYFLKRELVYAVLGLGAMTLALRTDYSVYRRLAYPLLGVSIVALVA